MSNGIYICSIIYFENNNYLKRASIIYIENLQYNIGVSIINRKKKFFTPCFLWDNYFILWKNIHLLNIEYFYTLHEHIKRVTKYKNKKHISM